MNPFLLSLLSTVAMPVVRHLLSAAGGYLAARNLGNADTVTQGVSILIPVIAAGVSIWDKTVAGTVIDVLKAATAPDTAPASPAKPSSALPVVAALAIALAATGAICAPAPAFAAPRSGPAGVEVVASLRAVTVADLTWAKARADHAGTPAARSRSACYGAWLAFRKATDAHPTILSPAPVPAIAGAFELAALGSEALPPVLQACTPAARAHGISSSELIHRIAGGR